MKNQTQPETQDQIAASKDLAGKLSDAARLKAKEDSRKMICALAPIINLLPKEIVLKPADRVGMEVKTPSVGTIVARPSGEIASDVTGRVWPVSTPSGTIVAYEVKLWTNWEHCMDCSYQRPQGWLAQIVGAYEEQQYKIHLDAITKQVLAMAGIGAKA